MSGLKLISNEDTVFLLENIVKDEKIKKKLLNKIILSEDDIIDIWDMCTDVVALEFDDDYNPTEKGLIIEDLIDKFYEMGENYNPERQYKQE